MIKRGLFLLICFIPFLYLGCSTTNQTESELLKNGEPVPYQKDEFPEWMHSLRRAEVIFAGSMPFSIFFSNIGYGIYQSIKNGSTPGYSIDSFTKSSSMTNEDRYTVLIISLSVSGAVALTDFIIGLFDTEDTDE